MGLPNKERSADLQQSDKEAVTGGGQFKTWISMALLIYLLLLAVGTISGGFKWATGDQAKELFAFATNPFLGLIVGTVCTALIQSSSTVTSIIVGLVAGGLPISMAIPMVMGANIGTTITNTLVSLGHAREKDEFRRAFSAATVHDFFNVLSVVVFLPLEMAFGLLEKSGTFIASFLVGGSSMSMGNLNFIKPITKPIIELIKDGLVWIPGWGGGALMIVLGIVMIFVAITLIGRLLKVVMVGKAKKILHTAIGKGPVSGIVSGTVVTVLVQSSSTTTSLAVPLAGSGVFTTRDIYPFTLGSNIGTCITAILAATAVSGNTEWAITIASVHFLYNLIGVIVIFGIPFLRELPLRGADWLAGLASEKKHYAFTYILCVFFVIPGLFLGISSAMS